MLLILLGQLWAQLVDHHQVSLCVWKSGTCLFVWVIQHDFSLSPWATQKNSVSSLVYSMPYCIYVALAPCSVVHYYMVLIFVQGAYMPAIVLKNHVLPFSWFCIQHTQCISSVSGVVMIHFIYSIFFFLLLILQCAETLQICCSIILCYIWSNHLPCRLWYIAFQILQVQVKCHTVFIESFCILMYYILPTQVLLMISCKWWYDVTLIIWWIIQQQLWMVIYFWFCMNFVPSCMYYCFLFPLQCLYLCLNIQVDVLQEVLCRELMYVYCCKCVLHSL